MMKKNEILVTYGTDYVNMTEELLKEADLADLIGDRRKRIGIKPNLVAPVLASEGGTTHPEVVEGLIRYLQENGFQDLTIMEGSWVGDKTEEAFEFCGYNELAEKYQVRLIDAQKEPAVTIDCGGLELHICRCATEVDYMINVPVMKGHCQTKITCALKNMKGMLPNSEKRRFHAMGLHDPIGHLALGVHQDFILVDSICGDLCFEDGGNPSKMDRIFACLDPVLCDSYVCQLLEYDTKEVPYIGIAGRMGAGSTDLKKTEIRELRAPLHNEREARPDKERMVRLAELAEDVDSCSACYGYLIPALNMLEQDGLLKDFKEKICIGQGYRGKSGNLGVGNCTKAFTHSLKGCPPTEIEMYEFLKAYIKETGRREG